MPAIADHQLYGKCEALQNDFVEMWEKIVNIDSGTGYGEGINKIAAIVIEYAKALGAEVSTYPAKAPDAGINVAATLKGSGSGKVLAMAHMDTVFPEGTAARRPFRIEGDWAYGPGVSDCKGSVLLCLFAMKLLSEEYRHTYDQITCLFNCDEEIGSPSSHELIIALAKQHDYVLCVEPGQVGDGVVIWRKGSGVLTVEVHGRAAHAGSAPEDGRNALMEIAGQILKLSQLGCPEKLTTLNFTKISAGDRTNVIPDYAVAKADIRAVYPEEFDRIEQEAKHIAASPTIADTRVVVTLDRSNPPFPQNAGTDGLIAKAREIYAEIGRTLLVNGAGGASDANWAASTGITVMDGLGPVKGGPNHTENERSNVASVVPRLYLLTRLFMELGNKK